MADFLTISQKVFREAGTGSGVKPAAVTGQVGRLLNIVNWVIDACTEIQNGQASWRFMRKTFSGTLTSGTSTYTAASFSITDFAEWITEQDVVTMYLTATGVSDEGRLRFIDWQTWRVKYGRGSQTNNRPTEYAISPAGDFVVGPIPNDTYTVNGEYRRTAQVLAANTDIPIIPERFHDVITWEAIKKVAEFDEDPGLYAKGKTRLAPLMFDMRRDQLPRLIYNSEPLA